MSCFQSAVFLYIDSEAHMGSYLWACSGYTPVGVGVSGSACMGVLPEVAWGALRWTNSRTARHVALGCLARRMNR